MADGPDFDAPLLRMAWDFKAQALARETRATAEITKRWADAWRDVSRDLARLIERMEAGELTPRETIRGQLYRRARAEELLARIRADLDELTGNAESIIGKAQIAEVDAALADTEKLVLATAPDAAKAKLLAAQWVRVPTDAAQMLTGALQPITPLGTLLAELGPTTAAGISQELTTGLITGRNPRVVARRIRDQWGLSLTRATRISRTETMRAYRAASLYQYQQNPGMVKGWQWICSFSERTCFPAGTLIHTIAGDKPIETIGSGELVLTHKGQWRRVTETMSRCYNGSLADIRTSLGRLVATGDHPVLIRRLGNYYWVPAEQCQLGDELLRRIDREEKHVEHLDRRLAVEGQVWHPDDAVPGSDQAVDLSLVGIWPAMPVGAVDFQSGIEARDIEVDGISVDGRFLLERDSEFSQAEPHVALWRCLSGIAAIAVDRAKLLIRHCRNYSEFLFTILACVNLRWPTARLAAEATIFPPGTKQFAASLAGGILGIRCPAGDAAVNAVARSIADERLATDRAGFFHFGDGRSLFAGSRAPFLGALTWRNVKCLSTDRAGSIFARAATRWGNSLKRESASRRAEFSPARSAAWRLGERLAADYTGDKNLPPEPLGHPNLSALDRAKVLPSPLQVASVDVCNPATRGTRCLDQSSLGLACDVFHGDIITRIDIHRKPCTTVYNLEVEGDHTYVANGFVVHNCIACIINHGKVFPATTPFADHVQGRCIPSPVLAPWRELGVDIDDPKPLINEGDGWRWFERSPESTQRRILGDPIYNAWKQGLVGKDQLWHVHHDDQWGDSIVASSLKWAMTAPRE